MNLLSLFSGIGGLELGLERAGMTTVGQVEIDKFCTRVLEKHWPEVPKHDDVRTAVEWWRSKPRPTIGAICGGFPCQPVSLAGKGKAQEDERWLWPEFAKTIRALRPRYVILENVPGLTNRGLSIVLGEMAHDGYDAIWSSFPAAAVGAPHLRRRIFIVAADANRVDVRFEPWRSGGQEWSRANVAGYDGQTWNVAYPDGSGLGERWWAGAIQEEDNPAQCSSETLADAQGDGRGPEWARRPHIPSQRRNGFPEESENLAYAASDSERGQDVSADAFTGGREAWPVPPVGGMRGGSGRGPAAWAIEPDVGRVANGVPARVDRLRTLGNAVVPQAAEYIGHIVMAAERA